MKCPNCGRENEDDAVYCIACGYPLFEGEPAVPENQPPKKKGRFLWLIIVLIIAAVTGVGGYFVSAYFDEHDSEAASETASATSVSETKEPVASSTEETATAIPSATVTPTAAAAIPPATATPESTLIPEAETDNEYFLPESNIREITDADLTGFSAKELTYARNEIYARHGKVFISSELNAYFQTKSWYHADSSFVDTDLSPLETSNAVTILHYQQNHGLEYKPS